MLAIYETVNRRLTRADEIEEGTWICLTAPSQEEIREVAATLDIEPPLTRKNPRVSVWKMVIPSSLWISP